MDSRQEYGEDREIICSGAGKAALPGKYLQEIEPKVAKEIRQSESGLSGRKDKDLKCTEEFHS